MNGKNATIENRNEKRKVYLDYVRVLAVIFVILSHSGTSLMLLPDKDVKRLFISCMYAVTLSCNALFVLLSGALLCSSSTSSKSIGEFYRKRGVKVLLPVLVYHFLYLLADHTVSVIPPKGFLQGFKMILAGPSPEAPHFSMLYLILSLYLSAPFLKILVNHLSQKEQIALVCTMFVFSIAQNYLPLIGVNLGVNTFLTQWEGVFMLGYLLMQWGDAAKDRQTEKKRLMILAVLAAVSYVLICFVLFSHMERMELFCNNMPPMVVIAAFIFLFFHYHRSFLEPKANPVIKILSKYGFSIIMIHWLFLPYTTEWVRATFLRYNYVACVLGIAVVTLAVSLIFALIFDNTVMKLLGKIVSLLQKGSGS